MERYPGYKDSGVKWIDEIPEQWEMWKISHAFKSIGSGTTPKTEVKEYYEDGDVNWVLTGDLNDAMLSKTSKKVTAKALSDYQTLRIFPVGSLVIAMYGATIGKLSLLGVEATTNQACCVLVDGSSVINTKYAFYWFSVNKRHIISLSSGGGQPNISQEIIRNLRLQLPPLPEQEAIASYLDSKTKLIDELIAKKQRLIELKKEERAAIINQAVTKGLDPDVPMKDSGIEWLGEIPEHWEIKRVAYLLKKGKEGIRIGPFGSSLRSDLLVDEGIKIYGQENIIKDDFTLGYRYINLEYFQSELNEYELVAGDLAVTMMGTTGKAKIIPELHEQGIMDSHLIRIRLKSNEFIPHLLAILINDSYALRNNIKFKSRGSIMEGLNSSIIKSLLIPVPPMTEQQKIMEYLLRTMSTYDWHLNSVSQQINLLKEYKTTLISEAVTGKIIVE